MIPAAVVAQEVVTTIAAGTGYPGGFGDLTSSQLATFPHFVVDIIDVTEDGSMLIEDDQLGAVVVQVTVRGGDTEQTEVAADRIRAHVLGSAIADAVDSVNGLTGRVISRDPLNRFADTDRDDQHVRYSVAQRFRLGVAAF